MLPLRLGWLLQLLCVPDIIPVKHGCVGMHGHLAEDPTQEDPEDPGPAPRKQGGPRDRKPAKGIETNQKHPKTPKAPESLQSGSTGVRQRRQRERGRAETESEQNHVS